MLGELAGTAIVVVIAVSATVFAAVGLLRRSRTLLVVAAAYGVALIVVTQRLPGNLPDEVERVVALCIGVGAASLAYVALVQEPVWLAERLGFKRRSRELEFDVRLSKVIADFNERVRAAEEAQASNGRGNLKIEAARAVEDLRAAQAPSFDWASLAREYIELMELRLEYLGLPATDDSKRRLLELNAEATAHREQLRADYRERARTVFRWP